MKTCLVVGNSDVFRSVVHNILDEYEVTVLEAKGNGRAIELCKTHMPDCVLVEWDLPPVDGLDLLKELRSLPGGEEIPVHFADDLNSVMEAILFDTATEPGNTLLH